MPTYHFVKSVADLPKTKIPSYPSTRISAIYGECEDPNMGFFRELEHTDASHRKMALRNCEGSFILIDRCKDTSIHPINKLHFGELKMGYPHAESYEKKGVESMRVDLAYLDSYYADQALRDLTRWRSQGYRRQQRDKLLAQRRQDGSFTQYGIPFRLAQLRITPRGLEHEIRVLERRVQYLHEIEAQRRIQHMDTIQSEERDDAIDESQTIYEHIVSMEELCYSLVETMRKDITTCNVRNNWPTCIVNEHVFDVEKKIGMRMRAVLRNIEALMTPEDMRLARHYWRNIEAWRNR